MSVKIRLIVSLILGGLCCLLSPLLWRRNKVNKEKTIFKKITKKKKLKIKEYERNKKTNNDNNENEVIKSGSLSSIRKRKSYNNSEEEDSFTSKSSSNNDENNSNRSYEESDHTKSSSEDSEKTYSENNSDSECNNFSFDRKFSKEHLYNSIEKIVSTLALHEPIIVYSRPSECELISRFIRYNNSPEALTALDDIFNEGINQYPKDSSVRLSYCILFWYLQGCINQVNDEWGIYESDDDIYKKKTEKEYKLMERIEETIQQVVELKPKFISRYKIFYIRTIIEEDKERQHDYEMRKKYEHFKKIKEQSSKYHISTLCYLRDFIEFIYGNDFNDTYYSNYLINIHNLKHLTEQSYSTFMQLYPDQVGMNNAYNLYLSDVMGDPYELMKSEMSISRSNYGDNKEKNIDNYEKFYMKHRGSNASNNSRRMSQNSTRRMSSIGNKYSSIDNDTNDNKKESINDKNNSFEIVEIKDKSINESENYRKKSLISSQMNNNNNNNEIKTQKRRVSINPTEIKISNINDIMEKPIPEEINSNSNSNSNELKDSHNVEENFESRETLSVIGIENTHRYRKGSIKTYSEISSSVNRDQRKSTVLKKNLSHILLKNVKNNTFMLVAVLFLIFIVSTALMVISYKKMQMIPKFTEILQISVTFPSIFINLSTKIRFLTIYGFLEERDIYNYYHEQIKDYLENKLSNKIIPYIEMYKTVEIHNPYFPFISNHEKNKSYKLALRSTEDSNRISFEYLSVYDLSKRIYSWADYINNIEYEEWKKPSEDTEISDISLKIHDFHARFFTDNLKYTLNDIYNSFVEDNINEVKNNYSGKNIAIIFIICTGPNMILLFVLYKFGIRYSINSVRQLQFKIFNIFKYLPKEYIDETIVKYNNDIDKIAGTISFEMNDSYLSIYDTSCKKNNILFKQRSITRTILFCYIAICLCSIIPLVNISESVLSKVYHLEAMYKRPSYIQLIHFFSHETYVGDSESFISSECEGILKDYLHDLEDIQENIIYSDDHKNVNKVQLFNELHYKKSCKFENVAKCDNETYYPRFGYTKEVVELPINELIDEYLRKTDAHISDYEILTYSIRHKSNSYSLTGKRNENYDEFEKIRNQYLLTSKTLKFQNYTKHHIIDGLERTNDAIIQSLTDSVNSMILLDIGLYILNILLIFCLFFYYEFKIIAEKRNEILEIVDLLFLLPASITNKIPQIRDFIEFGNINE